MKTARAPRPGYTGPLPSVEDLDTACDEVMDSTSAAAADAIYRVADLADRSDCLKSLLTAIETTCKCFGTPAKIVEYQGYNLIRGVLIGILAERKRRNGGVQ